MPHTQHLCLPARHWRIALTLISVFVVGHCLSQENPAILDLQQKVQAKEIEVDALREEIEEVKLEIIRSSIVEVGLPTDDFVMHSGMALSFDERTHQARWVAHVISPDIRGGTVSRTNDFRDDPKVEGEAVEADYFLKELLDDSTYKYDGFGYDRGHLAPSADFKWSRKALSESYYYSNMSPQDPDFNREDWAELEGILRAYVWRNEVPLHIVTMPLIADNDGRITRGVNVLQIPSQFVKVAFDPVNQKGVAFIMENEKKEYDLADFAITIDRAEEITGLDFFSKADDAAPTAESEMLIADWFPEETRDGVQPLYAPDLPKGYINTSQAARWMGSKDKVHVCGTVVTSRFSGSGNYWINIDKKFPNTVFSAYIRKDDFKNFDGIDKDYLINEQVCLYGKVTSMFDQPNMNLVRQEQVITDW